MWIVDGAPFAGRFQILSALPDPTSEFARDLVFSPQRVDWLGRSFWRKSENPDPSATMVLVHSMAEIEAEIVRHHHVGHRLFDWRRAHDVWYAATAPVFIDLGGPVLWRLGVYDDRGLRCVKRVLKRDLVAKNGGSYAVPDEFP
jgi:competence protein CoiA